MATSAYINKFRHLKKVYCDSYGSEISDITWYRISSQIRKYLNVELGSADAESLVRKIGGLKKRHRNFRINSDTFSSAMKLFSRYKDMDKTMTCADFLVDLSGQIDINKVSRTSRYVWFESSGIPFRLETKYHTNDFAFVAFRAYKSIHHNHSKTVNNAKSLMNNNRKDAGDTIDVLPNS
jgi:hypothetical protein